MNTPESVQYCIQCGNLLTREEKFGRIRPVCPQCGWIYFADPKVAVAVVVAQEGKVLLVQRVNPPFQGFWSLPAGFMDGGEAADEAASRECFEETGLYVKTGKLVHIHCGREHPQGADIVLIYRADVTGGELRAGDDAMEAGFFAFGSLPPLAFSSTRNTIIKLENALKNNNQ